MINPLNATILAFTKLRTRRTRTGMTVVVAGLLFGGLIAAIVVAQGIFNSVNSFSKEGLNSHYIVQATTESPLNQIMEDPSVKARAQDIYHQTIVDKKATAKRLEITYDPNSEMSPTFKIPIPAQDSESVLNPSAPAAIKAIAEWEKAHPPPGIAELKQVAAAYHPVGFYTLTAAGPSDGPIITMQHGQEDFLAVSQNNTGQQAQKSKDILQNQPLEVVSPELTRPFLLPEMPKMATPNTIPIIVSYSNVEQLLGLTPLPASATATQKLNRIKQLYAHAGSIVVTACYRNSVSLQQITAAINQAAEMAKNAHNKDYQKPDLIYGLPDATSCGRAVIIRDERTNEVKSQANKQDQFTQMFGGVTVPAQQKLTFQVVGFAPDPPSGASTTLISLLQSVVGSSLNGATVIPGDLLARLPDTVSIKNLLLPDNSKNVFAPTVINFVEFSGANDARQFIIQKSCSIQESGRCATVYKPFQLAAFGSNSLALQDAQTKFERIFRIAALVASGLAIIIMGGTIGRMIADGRRETAVFRAIGAKRIDIASIYVVYSLLLSCLVVVFAIAIGLALAFAADRYAWQQTTGQAQLLFGASNAARQFHFFSLEPKTIAAVLGAALASGVVSMLFPLVRNIRRNPIKDMRDES